MARQCSKTLLLVEDCETDVFFVKRVCRGLDDCLDLHTVHDGALAVHYLSGHAGYENRADHPLPDLIFLDINLPRLNGHEVLAWIRSQPAFRLVPVIMFSSSELPSDVNRSYQLGANSYLQKPSQLAELSLLMPKALHYWLDLNLSPTMDNHYSP